MGTISTVLKATYDKLRRKDTPNPGTLVYYRDKTGMFRWSLHGANGEIVCTGEQHGTSSDANRAVATAARLLNDENLIILRQSHDEIDVDR